MPVFESVVSLPRPPAEVFDFLCRPANLIVLSPPELNLRLADAPDRLRLGARVTVQGRRWGIAHRMVSEVTAFEEGVSFVEEQSEGPFRRFVHERQFEAADGTTRVLDRVVFEPPGGMLGLLLTAQAIERELRQAFAFRGQKLTELLGP